MYTRRKTPGWRPQFRGLGQVRKLVVSGLGCACKKSLGQDDTDLNFGIPTGLIDASGGGNIANVTPAANYPAAPDTGLVYAPSESDLNAGLLPGSGPYTPVGAGPSPSSGIVQVLNNPQSSPLSSGALMPTTLLSATTGLSATTWLLVGGVGLLALALTMGGGKRRR